MTDRHALDDWLEQSGRLLDDIAGGEPDRTDPDDT